MPYSSDTDDGQTHAMERLIGMIREATALALHECKCTRDRDIETQLDSAIMFLDSAMTCASLAKDRAEDMVR